MTINHGDDESRSAKAGQMCPFKVKNSRGRFSMNHPVFVRNHPAGRIS